MVHSTARRAESEKHPNASDFSPQCVAARKFILQSQNKTKSPDPFDLKTRLTQWGNCVDDDGWRWSFKWIVRGSSIDSAFLNFRLRIPLRLFLRRERLGWYFLKTEIGLYWNRAF